MIEEIGFRTIVQDFLQLSIETRLVFIIGLPVTTNLYTRVLKLGKRLDYSYCFCLKPLRNLGYVYCRERANCDVFCIGSFESLFR